MTFHMFLGLTLDGLNVLLLLELDYDRVLDRYEVTVFKGRDIIGYCHGYGNQGWNPQVNNIWVTPRLRRKGIATIMLSKVEDYFQHLPFPGTPIVDNPVARAFWKSYLSGQGRYKKTGMHARTA